MTSSLPPSPRRRSLPRRRRRRPRLDCGAGDDTELDWRSAPPASLSERFLPRGSLRHALLRRCSWLGGSFGARKGGFESQRSSSEEATRRSSMSECSLPPQWSTCPKKPLPLLRPSFFGLALFILRLKARVLLTPTTLRGEKERGNRARTRKERASESSFFILFSTPLGQKMETRGQV